MWNTKIDNHMEDVSLIFIIYNRWSLSYHIGMWNTKIDNHMEDVSLIFIIYIRWSLSYHIKMWNTKMDSQAQLGAGTCFAVLVCGSRERELSLLELSYI